MSEIIINENDIVTNIIISGSTGSTTLNNIIIGNKDVYVTGGTYNQTGGTATFTNNFGATFDVTGFTENVEILANKQNSMAFDGTGTKYPTVDAVNEQLNDFAIATLNTGFITADDGFTLYVANDNTLGIIGSNIGIVFKSLLNAPPQAPSDAIKQLSTRTVPLSNIGLSVAGNYIRYVGYRESDNAIIFSENTFTQSDTTCQLGLVLVKYSAGTTSFIDANRNIINKPDIAGYNNLDTTATGLRSNVVVKNNGTDLRIKNTDGSLIGVSVNWHGPNNDLKVINESQTSGATFNYIYPSLIGNVIPINDVNEIDPTKYWDGITLSTPPLPTNATVQRFLVTLRGNIAVQYGEVLYDTLADAKENVFAQQFINVLPIDSFVEIGRIALTKSTTDLSDLNTAVFYVTGQSGGAGGGGGSTTSINWGNISGNIFDQTDLQNQFVTKVNKAGDTMTGGLTAPSFVKSGGTSVQFLMADGSVSTLQSLSAITGNGTLNQVPKFSSSTAITNSNISDNGISVDIKNIDGNTTPYLTFTNSAGTIVNEFRAHNQNVAVGKNSLTGITSFQNTAVGEDALRHNISASTNTAVGFRALFNNISGPSNVALGYASLLNHTSGTTNTAVGYRSYNSVIVGDGNTGVGYHTGRFIADGSTILSAVSNSVLVGLNTRPSGNNETNIVVVGTNMVSNGSNSVSIGNSSILNNYFNGTVNVKSNTPFFSLTDSLGNYKASVDAGGSFQTSSRFQLVSGGTNVAQAMYYDGAVTVFRPMPNSPQTFVFRDNAQSFTSLAVLALSGITLVNTGTQINSTDKLQVNGGIFGSSFTKLGGLSSQYLMADGSVTTGITNAIAGTGTTNQIAKFNSLSSIVDSSITDNGSSVIINNPLDVNGTINATAFIKDGATSAQFLKGDGTLDSNVYLTSITLSGDVNGSITGGTVVGTTLVDVMTAGTFVNVVVDTKGRVISGSSSNYETLDNKQNSMAVDGFGIKYPTVDAVNTLVNNVARATLNTGFLTADDAFTLYKFDDNTLGVSATSVGILFEQLLEVPPFAPSAAIKQITDRTVPLSGIGLTGTGNFIKFVGYRESDDTVIFSDSTFHQVPSICQLGLVLVKYSAGTTSFIDNDRTFVNKPDIAGYSNLETTAIGLSSSVTVAPASTNDLKIQNSTGNLMGISVNWHGDNNDLLPVSASTATTFTYVAPLEPNIFPISGTTFIDPTKFFSGNTLVSLPLSGDSTIQRVLLTVKGTIVIQYGEQYYASFSEAKNNVFISLFTDILPPQSAIEIGRIVTTSGTTNLSDDTQAFFFVTAQGGGGVGSSPTVTWGTITGDITAQTDLVNYIDVNINEAITGTTDFIPKFDLTGITDSSISDDGLGNITTTSNIYGEKYNDLTISFFGENRLIVGNNNGFGPATTGNIILGSNNSGALTSNAFLFINNTTFSNSDGAILIGDNVTSQGPNTVVIGGPNILANYFTGDLTADKIIRSGGLSTEFLMADGSVSTGGGGGGLPSLTDFGIGTKIVSTSDFSFSTGTQRTIKVESISGDGKSLKITGGDGFATGSASTVNSEIFTTIDTTTGQWRGIAIAPNGDVYSSLSGVDIYKQTGGVGAFVALGQVARNWYGMAAHPNGNIYCCVYDSDMYMQTGGVGNFNALGQGNQGFIYCTVDSLGDVYATTNGGDIYKQTGGVGNFVALGQTGRIWRGITEMGNDLYACVETDGIYKQTNKTGAFVEVYDNPSKYWEDITSVGNTLYAIGNDDLYKSVNNGVTFTPMNVGFPNSSFGISSRNAVIYANGVSFISKSPAVAAGADASGGKLILEAGSGSNQGITSIDFNLPNLGSGIQTKSTKMSLNNNGTLALNGQLLVGNVSASTIPSAMIQLESTTQGFLPPRMTLEQRQAIVNPPTGLMVYQIDGLQGIYVKTSTDWQRLAFAQ